MSTIIDLLVLAPRHSFFHIAVAGLIRKIELLVAVLGRCCISHGCNLQDFVVSI